MAIKDFKLEYVLKREDYVAVKKFTDEQVKESMKHIRDIVILANMIGDDLRAECLNRNIDRGKLWFPWIKKWKKIKIGI